MGKKADWYVAKKFEKADTNWVPKVENDPEKELVTLVFTNNFEQYAYNLKDMYKKVKASLNNVTKQINKIKNDDKTSTILKDALTAQLRSYETARKDFLAAYKALYKGAIATRNKTLDDFMTKLNMSSITTQGVADKVQEEDLGHDDDGIK
ncbi:MAG: hypothetical protein IJI43_00820 [Bacilli bacterium]|nr:hypothetical protein [Bacilli bacterium]